MSGIVGSRLNIRGSGLVGSLGTDGQVLSSSGAGASAVYEDAGGFDVSSITDATALGAEPATTDEMVLSDAGTLKRMDMKYIYNEPLFRVTKSSAQDVARLTTTKWLPDTEQVDSGGAFGSNKFTVPTGMDGTYWFVWKLDFANMDADEYMITYVYKNGALDVQGSHKKYIGGDGIEGGEGQTNGHHVMVLAADDYIELYVRHVCDLDPTQVEAKGWWAGFRMIGG